MNRDDFFPSRFFKTGDVDATPFVGRIRGVLKESVNTDKGPTEKPVMYFTNTEKGFILNVTNYTTLSEIFGSDETNDWRGQAIELYAADTSYGGKRLQGIRVREPQPQPQGAKASRRPTGEVDGDEADGDEVDGAEQLSVNERLRGQAARSQRRRLRREEEDDDGTAPWDDAAA